MTIRLAEDSSPSGAMAELPADLLGQLASLQQQVADLQKQLGQLSSQPSAVKPVSRKPQAPKKLPIGYQQGSCNFAGSYGKSNLGA